MQTALWGSVWEGRGDTELPSKGKQARPRKGWVACSLDLGPSAFTDVSEGKVSEGRERLKVQGRNSDLGRTQKGIWRWRTGPELEIPLISRLPAESATGGSRTFIPVSFCFPGRLVHLPAEYNLSARKQTSCPRLQL